jgi:hypothetical protein
MIFPCIDLMDGKVVQLVQGREKALEADSPEEMLRRFAAFPEIQVIDLDAAMGRGSNGDLRGKRGQTHFPFRADSRGSARPSDPRGARPPHGCDPPARRNPRLPSKPRFHNEETRGGNQRRKPG